MKGRLRKLEQVAAPPPPRCDCPFPTTHYRLADGTTYPPDPPCLRGQCPEAKRFRDGPPPVRKIVMAMAVRAEDGPPPGYPIRVHAFRAWDPVTDKPRLRVIVWRDEASHLCYHGPPRWYEIEGLEEPRVVRAHDVTETLEEIIEELRRTDETPALADLNAGADRAEGSDQE